MTGASVLIRLVDVVKVFETGSKRRVVALDGITMDVRDGEFVSLVGPSGCGKSTLLSLVAELEPPTSGTISFIGEQRCQTRTAMVWQDYRLLPWRVIETNVGLGPEFRKRPEEERQGVVQRLLNKVRLAGFEQFFPSQLSGGMKQKAGIARALANDPEILLMDEPFADLDAGADAQNRHLRHPQHRRGRPDERPRGGDEREPGHHPGLRRGGPAPPARDGDDDPTGLRGHDAAHLGAAGAGGAPGTSAPCRGRVGWPTRRLRSRLGAAARLDGGRGRW
jgi:ABC-type nitrate/sulfonate/bicarbonate transport system ATPase subunit